MLEDGAPNIVFTVSRTGPTDAALTVNYIIGGTATNGTDYAAIGTSVVIPIGSATGTITVNPTPDVTTEADETVILTLAADAAYTRGTPNTATATITNDDVAPGLPTVTVARTPASVLEDGTPTMAFAFTRTGSTAAALVVNYTISGTAVNGTDYVTIPTSLTIPSGSLSATVTIDPIADATVEPDETVILSIASDAAYTVGSPSTATGTITDDDSTLPTVTIARTSGNVPEDGAGNMTFTVARTGETTASLAVSYTIGGTATNGVDYAAIGTTVTIPSGSATATITIDPTVDALLEGNETVTLTLAASGAYTIGSQASAIGLIQNDETGPNVFAFASSDTVIVGEAAGTATITLARSGSTAAAATVEYTISASGGATPGDDYTPVSQLAVNLGQAEFAIGAATTTITVPIINDVTVEGAEGFSLGIQNPSSGSLGAPRTAVVRIIDNDGASRVSFADPSYEVAESAGNLAVTLIRSGSIAAAASVTLATTAGTAVPGVNYTTTSVTVTFPIGNNIQTANIPILVDPVSFNFRTFSLGLTVISGATISGSATAEVQILGPGVDFAGATIEPFVTGLVEPTTMKWLPGDPTTMLVAQKGGQVRVVQGGVLRTAPLVDRSAVVNSILDRGMIGLAIHPAWPAQPFVYIVYNYDPPETIGGTGLAGPDGGGNRPARVERLTVDPGTLLATSGTVIVGTNSTWAFTSRPDLNSTGDISILPSGIVNGTTITASPADISVGYQDNSPGQAGIQNENIRDYITTDSQSHGISNLEFGPDGMLYVAVGDGSSFNFTDPRAVRCQDIGNLSGKLLRVDPITGNGVPGNPYYAEASGTPPGTSNQSKVFYYGLRNGFRFTFDPVTELPVIGDVGQDSWEDVHTGPPGSNFGWPYREGPAATAGYSSLPQALAFEANGRVNAGSPNPLPAVAPIRAFSHSSPDNFNSLVLGQFYNANSFVYADVIDGRVFTGTMNTGRTAFTSAQIATGQTYVVDLRPGPDGLVYGCQLFSPGFSPGRIIRWVPNSAPSGLPAPTLYLPLRSNLLDASANNFTVTTTAAPTIGTDPGSNSPVATGSAFFTASAGSFLQIADDPRLDFGTGPWFMSFWAKRPGVGNTNDFPTIVSKGSFQTSTGAWAMSMNLTSPPGPGLGFGYGNPWVEGTLVSGGPAFPIDTWVHFYIERSPLNIMTLRTGGIVRSTLNVAGVNFDNVHPLRLGSALAGASPYQGWLQEFVLCRGANLTVDQINGLQTAPYVA